MLSDEESNFIKNDLYSSDHDYYFWSHLLGEPFLYDDILYYFDGKTLSIIGFPFDKEFSIGIVTRKIAEGIKWWSNKAELFYICYLGPSNIKLGNILGKTFYRYYFQEPSRYNVDVFLNLRHPQLLKTRNAKESISKVKRHGYATKIRHREFLTYQHINLLRQLILDHPMFMDDLSALITSVSLVNNKFTTFFELEIDGNLVGFIMAHEFYEHKPFMQAACFDHTVKGSSDALYSTVIKYYIDKGASWLGLGYSGDEGLYNYKTKWGGYYCSQPIYQLAWKKKGIRERAAGYCLHWQSSLIINKV
jgi:hypothetical protein